MRIALNSTAHIKESGEQKLKGKKSLFEDILVFQTGDLASDHLERTTRLSLSSQVPINGK